MVKTIKNTSTIIIIARPKALFSLVSRYSILFSCPYFSLNKVILLLSAMIQKSKIENLSKNQASEQQ